MVIQLESIEKSLVRLNDRMERADKRMLRSESRLELVDKKLDASVRSIGLVNRKLGESIREQREFAGMQSKLNKYFIDYIRKNPL